MNKRDFWSTESSLSLPLIFILVKNFVGKLDLIEERESVTFHAFQCDVEWR